jgi:hypothetical protein
VGNANVAADQEGVLATEVSVEVVIHERQRSLVTNGCGRPVPLGGLIGLLVTWLNDRPARQAEFVKDNGMYTITRVLEWARRRRVSAR